MEMTKVELESLQTIRPWDPKNVKSVLPETNNRKQKKNRNKIKFIGSIVGLIIIIAIISTVVVKRFLNKAALKPSDKKDEICKTPKCSEIGLKLYKAINPIVDPCNDFYSFSCGFWILQASEKFQKIDSFIQLQGDIYNELIDTIENINTSSLPHPAQQVITAYRACVNSSSDKEQSAKMLKIMLRKIGGWPMANYYFNEDTYNLMNALAIAIKKFAVMPLLSFNVGPDDRNTTRNIIMIDKPKLPELQIDSENGKTIIGWTVSNLGPIWNRLVLYTDFIDIIKLERLIKETVEDSNLSTEENENSRTWIKIKDAKNIIPGMNLNFFQIISNDTLNSMDGYITEDNEILIKNKKYFQSITNSIKKHNISKRTLANFVGSRLILQFPTLLLNAFESTKKRYRHKFSQLKSKTVEQYNCVDIIAISLNFATDYIYVKYIREYKKNEKIVDMIKHILEAFRILATQSMWIDKKTLSFITEKVNSMSINVGYPEWILNETKLIHYYSLLPKLTDNFSFNVIKIFGFLNDKRIELLKKTNNITEWPNIPGLTVTSVNAAYFLQRNAIYIPLAILNPPFFDPDVPWYINFGSIGPIIAHEITHGFDNDGSHRSKTGELQNWWSNKSRIEFEKRSKCFIQQYDNFTISKYEDFISKTDDFYNISKSRFKIDGKQTLGENIADNGAVRQIFLAYKNWERKYGKEPTLTNMKYSPYELLYLSYGYTWCEISDIVSFLEKLEVDEHSPKKYRVLGPLANSAEFSNSYKCPTNSRMNPARKCIIW